MKSLKVFGTTYKTKSAPLKEHGVHGLCNVETKQILIDKSLKGDQYTETILHELFHAVFHECSIYQTVSNDVEEILVDVFAKAVVKNFKVVPKSGSATSR